MPIRPLTQRWPMQWNKAKPSQWFPAACFDQNRRDQKGIEFEWKESEKKKATFFGTFEIE